MTEIQYERVISCVCGCNLMVFKKYSDEDQVYMEVYENAFYGRHRSKVGNYLARLWSAIRGKEYLLFDIVLSHEEAGHMAWTMSIMTEDK